MKAKAIYFFSSSRRPERPRKSIQRELLENLLTLKMPIADIANFFHVSRPVVYNAMREFGIEYNRFSDICDDQLKGVVNTIKEHHPRAGEVMVQGHLRAQGVHVPCDRMRSAIQQVQPIEDDLLFDRECIWCPVRITYGT